MAPGRAARRRARGGGVVPATRRSRARLVVGAAAILCAGALALAIALSTERLAAVVASVGAAGVVLLAAGVSLRREGLVPLAIGSLGAAYGLSLFLPEGPLDPWAPLVAAALVLVAELSYWSLELTTPVRAEAGVVARRSGVVAASAFAAAPVGALVLAAATVSVEGGILWDAAGIAAAAAAVGLAAWVARGSRA